MSDTPHSRDPHSFKPGDPPVELPRATASRCLDQLEMWADVVRERTGLTDSSLRDCITDLTAALSTA